MLQELANGHRAEARVADGGQIEYVADRLVQSELAGLNELENADRGELLGQAGNAKEVSRLGRSCIRWRQGISMVKDQFSVPAHRKRASRDVPQRHEIGHRGVQRPKR